MANKSYPRTEAHKKHMSEALKNLKNTNPEGYERMKKGRDWNGRKHKEETKIKANLSHKKYYHEHPEAREKISKQRTGSKLSLETRNKISLGMGKTYQRILDEAKILEKQGYRVIPIAHVIPDIIAIKDGEVYAVEVEYGNPNYDKYEKNDYEKYFDGVIWLIKK